MNSKCLIAIAVVAAFVFIKVDATNESADLKVFNAVPRNMNTTPTPAPNGTNATPTAAPNATPTAAPSNATPTAAPTMAPTNATPTAAPTMAPTNATPTAAPSTVPTNATPTAAPSTVPTNATPTAAPTGAPTAAPTMAPTAAPPAPTPAPNAPPPPPAVEVSQTATIASNSLVDAYDGANAAKKEEIKKSYCKSVVDGWVDQGYEASKVTCVTDSITKGSSIAKSTSKIETTKDAAAVKTEATSTKFTNKLSSSLQNNTGLAAAGVNTKQLTVANMTAAAAKLNAYNVVQVITLNDVTYDKYTAASADNKKIIENGFCSAVLTALKDPNVGMSADTTCLVQSITKSSSKVTTKATGSSTKTETQVKEAAENNTSKGKIEAALKANAALIALIPAADLAVTALSASVTVNAAWTAVMSVTVAVFAAVATMLFDN